MAYWTSLVRVTMRPPRLHFRRFAKAPGRVDFFMNSLYRIDPKLVWATIRPPRLHFRRFLKALGGVDFKVARATIRPPRQPLIHCRCVVICGFQWGVKCLTTSPISLFYLYFSFLWSRAPHSPHAKSWALIPTNPPQTGLIPTNPLELFLYFKHFLF